MERADEAGEEEGSEGRSGEEGGNPSPQLENILRRLSRASNDTPDESSQVAGPPGSSLNFSPSMGMSQQPGPSGFNVASPSFSPSLGGRNFPQPLYSPPQHIPPRPPPDVFQISPSQDLLVGGASQHVTFDPMGTQRQHTEGSGRSGGRGEEGSGEGSGHAELMRILSQDGHRREREEEEEEEEEEEDEDGAAAVPAVGGGIAPGNRIGQILAALSANPEAIPDVRRHLYGMQMRGAAPSVQPAPERPVRVPTISDVSSQSSDEDMAGRRRRRRWPGSEGESRSVPTSSLVWSVSLREQALTHTDSSSGETTATELAATVPDPETMKRLYLERAERTVAKVPKMPSRIKKTLQENRQRLASASSATSEPTLLAAENSSTIPDPAPDHTPDPAPDPAPDHTPDHTPDPAPDPAPEEPSLPAVCTDFTDNSTTVESGTATASVKESGTATASVKESGTATASEAERREEGEGEGGRSEERSGGFISQSETELNDGESGTRPRSVRVPLPIPRHLTDPAASSTSCSSEDEAHTLISASAGSWGADTDASTYPGSQTTSSSATAASDSASTIISDTSSRKKQRTLRTQVLVLSQSSSEEGGQPAPLSSTPQAVARPLRPSPALDPPRGLRRKHTSEEMSTSTSTVSSSGSFVAKVISRQIKQPQQQLPTDDLCSPPGGSEERRRRRRRRDEGEDGERERETEQCSPLAKDSQSPNEEMVGRGGGVGRRSGEVIPNTPPDSLQLLSPHQTPDAVAASQDLFQETAPQDTDTLDQDPAWYPPLALRQADSQETQKMDVSGEGETSQSQSVKRQTSTESSSPDAACLPPRKRKRSASSSSGQPALKVKKKGGGGGEGRGEAALDGSSSSSSGNVSSSHTSSNLSTEPSSSGNSGEGRGGGGGGGGGGTAGSTSSPDDDHTQSEREDREGRGRVGGGGREDGESSSRSVSDSQVSQISAAPGTRDSQELVSKNISSESLSLSRLHPVDPSSGCEADRSLSLASSFPTSSTEACITTSTPDEEGEGGGEGSGILASGSSPSVGYGAEVDREDGGEQRESKGGRSSRVVEEMERRGENEETQEEREKFGEVMRGGEGEQACDEETVAMEQSVELLEEEQEDMDATLGLSEIQEEEAGEKGGVAERESPLDEATNTRDPLSATSSSSWRLVCSSSPTSCSTKLPARGSTHLPLPSLLPLSDSQLTESLPDSEQPLVIDVGESQGSQLLVIDVGESQGSQPLVIDMGESQGSQPLAIDVGESQGLQPLAIDVGESQGSQPLVIDVGESQGSQPLVIDVGESQGSQPLVIDVGESQVVSSNSTGGSLTAVAALGVSTSSHDERTGTMKGEEKDQRLVLERLAGECVGSVGVVREGSEVGCGVNAAEEEAGVAVGGEAGSKGGLIRESWKLLSQVKASMEGRSNLMSPPSPLRSQWGSQLLESECESVTPGEASGAAELSTQTSFSLHFSQSQSEVAPGEGTCEVTSAEVKQPPSTCSGTTTASASTSSTSHLHAQENEVIHEPASSLALTCSEELQQTAASEELQQTAASEELQQTAASEELQQTAASEELQQTAASEELQQTAASEGEESEMQSAGGVKEMSERKRRDVCHGEEEGGSVGFSVHGEVGVALRPVPVYESVPLDDSSPSHTSPIPSSHHHQQQPSQQQVSQQQEQKQQQEGWSCTPLPVSTASQTPSVDVSQTSPSSSSSAGTPFQLHLPHNGLLRPHQQPSQPPPITHTSSPLPSSSVDSLPPRAACTTLTAVAGGEEGDGDGVSHAYSGDTIDLSAPGNENWNNPERSESAGRKSSSPCPAPGGVSLDTKSPRKCLSLRKRRRSSSVPAVEARELAVCELQSTSEQQQQHQDHQQQLQKHQQPQQDQHQQQQHQDHQQQLQKHQQPQQDQHQQQQHQDHQQLQKQQQPQQDQQQQQQQEDHQHQQQQQQQQDHQQQQQKAFVLGMADESREEIQETSQFVIPELSLPGDSQFEASSESCHFLFHIEGPSTCTSHQLQPATVANEQINRPPGSPAAPQGSIFSNVGASRRMARAVRSDQKDIRVSGRVSDPFDFDSQSHHMVYVPHRKKQVAGVSMGEGEGRDELCRAGGSVVTGEETVYGGREKAVEERDRGRTEGVGVSGECEGVDGEKAGGQGSQVRVPVLESQQSTVHSACPETVLPVATETVSPSVTTSTSSQSSQAPSPHPYFSTPLHPPHTHLPSVAGSFPSTSHNLTPHISFSTPSVSTDSVLPLFTPPHLTFTSPSSRISPQALREYSSGYRANGQRYTMRHVRTYHLEVKVVSQEVYQGDEVVDGLGSVWQEDSKVTSSPEERIEVHPYTTHSVPSSPTHTLTLSSPTPMVAMSSLATTSGILTSPLVTTYTPHSTPSIPVRQASKTSQVSEATPTIPVRQVSRTNRPSEATSTIPVRQVSNDSQTSAASVVETQNGLSDSSCDSEGVMGRGREAAEEEEEEPMVSKEENRKEHTHILQSTVHQSSSHILMCSPQTPRRGSKARHSIATTAASPLTRQKSGKTLTGKRRGFAAGSSSVGAGDSAGGAGAGDSGDKEIEVGSLVIARWRNGSWYPATVTGCKNGRWSVQYEDGDRATVSASHVFHRSQLRLNLPVTAMDDSKRGRSGLFAGFTGAALSEWGLLPLSGGGVKEMYTYVQLEVPSATAEKCVGSFVGKNRGVKRVPSEVLVSPVVKKRRVHSSLASEEREEEEEQEREDDDKVLQNQLNLFDGFSFLLTQRTKEDRHLATPPNERVDKELVSSQIRSRMGHVLENADQTVVGCRCYVLSDAYCRTKKYLMGLAVGLPCISYGWIKECIDKGEVVDHSVHLLPAGLAAVSGEVVPWRPRREGKIMAGVKLALEGSRGFQDFWSAIMQRAGAKVEDSFTTGTVVYEAGRQLPARLRGRAAKGGLTLVSSEWLAQCLIHAQQLDRTHFACERN